MTSILVLVACGLGLWALVAFGGLLLARFEKIRIRGELQPTSDSYLAAAEYLQRVQDGLGRAGFVGGDTYAVVHDGRRRDGCVMLFSSSDGRILAHVETGSVLGLLVRRLSLRTLCPDGRVVETCDSMQMPDLTGRWTANFLCNASVEELLVEYSRGVGSLNDCMTLGPTDLLAAHERLEALRATWLSDQGLAILRDEGRSWSFSWLGAWRLRRAYPAQRARMWAQSSRLVPPQPR